MGRVIKPLDPIRGEGGGGHDVTYHMAPISMSLVLNLIYLAKCVLCQLGRESENICCIDGEDHEVVPEAYNLKSMASPFPPSFK